MPKLIVAMKAKRARKARGVKVLTSTRSGVKIVGAAQSKTRTARQPKIRNLADGGCEISHEEFVADIITDASNAFAYDVYSLNPTDPVTFPWLSEIAQRFESYRLIWLKVQARGMTGTGASGRTLLAVDYDSKDNVEFATKADLMNFYKSISAPVWDSFEHVSSVADLQRVGPWRFVNESSDLDSVEDRLSSAGNLFVGTTETNAAALLPGSSTIYANTAIGELYVDYCIELKTPVMHVDASSKFTTTQALDTGNTTGTVVTGNLGAGSFTDVLNGASQVLDMHGAKSVIGAIEKAVLSGNIGALNAWQFISSGAAVPVNQVLIKFLRDFAGQLILDVNGITPNIGGGVPSGTYGPSTLSIATATTANAGSNAVQQPSVVPAYVSVNDAASTASSGGVPIFTGAAAWDVIAQKGSGLAISSPAFYWMVNAAASTTSLASRLIRLGQVSGINEHELLKRRYSRVGKTIIMDPLGPLGVSDMVGLGLASVNSKSL